MKCFAIITDPENQDGYRQLSQNIDAVFNNKYVFAGQVGWVVSASNIDTTTQVRDALKISKRDDESPSIVILRITSYGGYYDGGLWECLSTWDEK